MQLHWSKKRSKIGTVNSWVLSDISGYYGYYHFTTSIISSGADQPSARKKIRLEEDPAPAVRISERPTNSPHKRPPGPTD